MRKLVDRHWLKWLLLIPIAALVWATFSHGTFIASRRFYFWIGPAGLQLHYGWHTPGWGHRSLPPQLHHALNLPPIALHATGFALIGIFFRRNWGDVIRFARARPRYPAGHCQQCGYNLTGNVSGTCPECGEKAWPIPHIPPPSLVSRATLALFVFVILSYTMMGIFVMR